MSELDGDFWDFLAAKKGRPLSPLHVVADWIDQNWPDRRTAAMMLRDIGVSKNPPFITGSQAYGTPRDDSDTDICCLVTAQEYDYLKSTLPQSQASKGVSIMVENWNLIALVAEVEYRAWRDATIHMIARRPFSKAEAVVEIDQLTKQYKMGAVLKGEKKSFKVAGSAADPKNIRAFLAAVDSGVSSGWVRSATGTTNMSDYFSDDPDIPF